MGHPIRCRDPDIWQHVTIRGIAQRSIFDRQSEGQLFEDRAARSVDKGDLRIAVYCLMRNHAHFIARSPSGRLGDAMRDIESVYVRRFNRPRGRRGHLMQARYWAKPIRSRRYMTAAIAYVDLNPVEAGLVERPASYPLSSARHYARTSGPSWLDRSWVETYLAAGRVGTPYRPSEYARVFGTRTSAGARRWTAEAMESRRPDDVTLDALIEASPDHILQWMDERAQCADGTSRSAPIVDEASLFEAIRAVPASVLGLEIGPHRNRRTMEQGLRVGLLRRLVGASFSTTGLLTAQSLSAAQRTARVHEWALTHDAGYRELVAQVTRAALDACHPRTDRV